MNIQLEKKREEERAVFLGEKQPDNTFINSEQK